MITSPCPSDQELAEYVHAGDSAKTAKALDAHIRQCSACQDRLKLFETHDSLASDARRAMRAPIATDPLETVTISSFLVPQDAPARVGQYQLLRVIASGGMGTVYEAVQQSPRRIVAVKLMKKGITSRSAMRRFVHESQILARLRHPAIAHVFEAGIHSAAEGEVPFFAMEYIPGARSITAFARDKLLSARDRLALFSTVCDAVHHGHQKGVIHRDLKPSNILVDAGGQVKIIDFGVARSTDADLAMATLQTEMGQLIGTLQYMSPEQCDADPHNIDVRSDVYALGVVLYELLSGRPPYDLARVPLHEATRIIREQEPTCLSVLGRALRGDVETIALKALEKDRERRYRSASEFGDDINRYLRGEGISARPPSLGYQLRVFARRHRTLVAATVSVFLVLTAALVFTSILYQRAAHARVLAERGQAQAKAVTEFLTETLSSVNPEKAVGRDVTVRQLLDKTAAEIQSGFPGQPLVEATIRTTLGRTYMSLAAYTEAEAQLRKGLELRQAEAADCPVGSQQSVDVSVETISRTANAGEAWLPIGESQWLLGLLEYYKGNYVAAENAMRNAITIRRTLLGNEHVLVADSLNDLALVFIKLKRFTHAERTVREALGIRTKTLGAQNMDTAESLNNLALALAGLHRNKEAEDFFQQALGVWHTLIGETHPRIATALTNFALLKQELGDLRSADRLLRNSVAVARKVYPNGHDNLASTLNALGSVLIDEGAHAEAEVLIRESLQMYEALHDKLPYDAAGPLSRLGQLCLLQEDDECAVGFVRRSIEVQRNALGAEHPEVRKAQAAIANKLLAVARKYETRGESDRAQQMRAYAENLRDGNSLVPIDPATTTTGNPSSPEP